MVQQTPKLNNDDEFTNSLQGTSAARETTEEDDNVDPVIPNEIAVNAVSAAQKTRIEALDNTEANIEYTNPVTSATGLVTAQQAAALKLFNDNSTLKVGSSPGMMALGAKLASAAFSSTESPPIIPGDDDGDDDGGSGGGGTTTLTTPVTAATRAATRAAGLRSELDEFLNSDPNLVLNQTLNQLREKGESVNTRIWFRNNFDNFWGQYKGIVAQKASDGTPFDLSFVNFVKQMNLDQEQAASSSTQTAAGRGSRFASFARGSIR